MKSLVKAISKPFKSSKTQKSISQKENYNSKESNPDQFQKGIDFKDGAAKVQTKFNFLYSQVQKMVEQLGTALHFKEKMTEQQKRQLIYQLSSMAMNQNKMGTQMMDEDVLSADDEDQNNQKPTESKSLQVAKNHTFKDKQSEAATRSSQHTSPNNLASPQKQLKDLFQEFERNQQESLSMQTKQNKKEQLSTYGQIKSKMSSFFSKNSSKVFKLLRSSKNEQVEVASQSTYKEDNDLSRTDPEVKKQKKKSFISNILPSWGSKKENKYGNISSSTIVQSKVNVKL